MKKREKYLEWGMLALFFALALSWSLTTWLQGGPDEEMRYQVAKYLYSHPGKLPHGEEEAIRNETWGISYAFYPILSYMVSAVFMWIAGIFSTSKDVLLHAARLADVLFMTVAAGYTIQIGKRLFGREKGLFFSALVIFLPGYLYLGTYVNNDSLAMMAAAMILYAWVKYLEEGWTWKNCILLAVGMGICFLSYYNAYGWILWSFFFFCLTVLLCSREPMKERVKFLFSRGIVIAAVTLGLSGWWFVRNYFLYDGDFLGRKASSLCAEKYAKEKFKPSVYLTPAKMGWSLRDLFIYQDPGWSHNWIMMVLISFVGLFGSGFNIYMNETVSKVYIVFLAVGSVAVCLMLREFCWKKQTVEVRKSVVGREKIKVKTVRTSGEWNARGIFNGMMAASLVTPVILFVQYAYSSDNQAQGRYIMSAVYPIMYFVTCGYGKILERFVKQEKIRKWFYTGVTVLWMAGAVLTYFLLIIPTYS